MTKAQIRAKISRIRMMRKEAIERCDSDAVLECLTYALAVLEAIAEEPTP